MVTNASRFYRYSFHKAEITDNFIDKWFQRYGCLWNTRSKYLEWAYELFHDISLLDEVCSTDTKHIRHEEDAITVWRELTTVIKKTGGALELSVFLCGHRVRHCNRLQIPSDQILFAVPETGNHPTCYCWAKLCISGVKLCTQFESMQLCKCRRRS